MKRNERIRIDAQLETLYSRVPDLDCKGLCHTSCGVIEASTRERARMQEHGVRLPYIEEFLEMDAQGITIDCPALTEDKACGVYEVRPMICRLWGATDSMPCPYGCKPVDGGELLHEPEGFELLGDSIAVGGDPRGGPPISGAEYRRIAETRPELIQPYIERGKRVDAERARKQMDGMHE